MTCFFAITLAAAVSYLVVQIALLCCGDRPAARLVVYGLALWCGYLPAWWLTSLTVGFARRLWTHVVADDLA